MSQWEKEINRYYGSLREYVLDQIAQEKPNVIKTLFERFYREMEMLCQEGCEWDEAWERLVVRYDIQEGTIDDYVLSAVLYSH